jgi:hypothetical protein
MNRTSAVTTSGTSASRRCGMSNASENWQRLDTGQFDQRSAYYNNVHLGRGGCGACYPRLRSRHLPKAPQVTQKIAIQILLARFQKPLAKYASTCLVIA